MSAPHTASDIKTKILPCGIGGSDLHTTESGKGPLTSQCAVGHEIVGEVTLVGHDINDQKVDDRVNAMSNDAVVVLSRSANKEEQKVGDCGTTKFVVKTNKEQVATGIGLADVLRSSYAKVLALMALLVCVAARATPSAVIPQDVMRNSRALKAAYTPVQTKRNLRFDVAKSDLTFDFEERDTRRLRNLPLIEQVMDEIASYSLKVPNPNVDAAANKIGQWSEISVQKHTEADIDNIFNRLSKQFTDYELAHVFAYKKQDVHIAERLEALQTRHWKNAGKSAADVFDLLKLGETNEPLFENPLFYRLFFYIESSVTPGKTVYPTLYSVLSSKFTDEALVEACREGVKTHGRYSSASTLLEMRLLKGQLAGETHEISWNLVGLDTGYDARLRDTFFAFAHFYEKHSSLVRLTDIFGESKVAEMLATVNMKSPVVVSAFQLRNQLYQKWLKNPLILKGLVKTLSNDGVSEAGIKVILGQLSNYAQNNHAKMPSSL